MARIGISSEKSTLFRGVQQVFSNTYYYTRPIPILPTEYDVLLNEVVLAERAIHSNLVNFLHTRLWTADGNPGENEMLHQRDETGSGTGLAVANMDKERAYLLQWPAGKDSRGHPVKLRKWYHACGARVGFTITDGMLANTEVLPQGLRDAIEGFANDLKVIGPTADTWSLCAKSGRTTTGDVECHRYLEHHQLGDMWRG